MGCRRRGPSEALPLLLLRPGTRLAQYQTHPILQTHSGFEFLSSVPSPWYYSFWNILSNRKGEPWKILLSASSGQKNYSIYVSAAKE